MSLEIVIPKCPKCGGTLVKKEKDGETYYACPNWKPNNEGCEGYFWSPDKKKRSGGGSKESLAEQKKTNELLEQILEMVSSIVKDTTES